MPRSIIRSNFQRHGSMFHLTNSEIAWKTLNAIILKKSCLLVNKRSLCSTKIKKNICKTFYRLKMWRIPKEISEINTSFTLHEIHVPCRILVHHHSFHFFFNHPTSKKRFVSWAFGNRLLNPLCGKMLDWLNFRLGEIIGLIHVLKRDIIKIKHSCVITFAQYIISTN